MRYCNLVIVLLFFAFSFTHCTSENSGSGKDIAKNICDCAQPVVDLNLQIQDLGKNGKIEAMTALMEQAGAAMESAIDCARKQITEKTNKEDLRESLISSCKLNERMVSDLVEKLGI